MSDSARPGPDAQVVGRPRVTAVIGFCYILAVGAALILNGRGVAVGFGAALAPVALFCLAATLSTRVWIDGTRLYIRRLGRYAPPVRLDRLTRAHLSDFGRNNGRELRLSDADGVTLRLDATNVRLARLYKALAGRIRHDDPVANPTLQRRMAKHRPGLPLGPS